MISAMILENSTLGHIWNLRQAYIGSVHFHSSIAFLEQSTLFTLSIWTPQLLIIIFLKFEQVQFSTLLAKVYLSKYIR